MECDKDCRLTHLRRRDDGPMIVRCEDHRREFVVSEEEAGICDTEECDGIALRPETRCPRHRRRMQMSTAVQE
jgi:hypothetical protein